MSDDESDVGGEGFGRQAGMNSQIEVYGRLRPSNKNDKQLCMFGEDHRSVEFRIPKDAMGGYVNNQREVYEFKMNHIFDDTATQEEVFDGIGKQTVNNVLEGFNATIFAYGQTGSGKTYSITGGAERYEDRGLIPRCLSMIFEEKEKRSNEYQYSISISYLEIYNDDGYDLLDAEHESKSLSDLPKVTMFEDESGHIHMRNIHLLPANSVDEALNLLFVGDTNRVVCQTPSNDTSTRSHCIFTIYVESREVGGSRIRRSKLHLVDLAGSERIKKTGIGGKVLTEALHINLALHYLEQVIVALHKRSKDKNVHIPYRNSLMTSVLRDSLGGNCRTIMIATMSAQRSHLDESISTCRFAARVAMVKNAAFVNEEIDPKLVIRKLKLQVKELKEEIASLQGSKGVERPLDEDELARSRQMVLEFLNNDKPSLEFGIPNKFKAEACFHVFKQLLIEAQSGNNAAVPPIAGTSNKALLGGPGGSSGGLGGGPIAIKGGSSSNSAANDEEVKKLRLLVSSRDNEIAILVSMLKNNVKDGREIEMLESIRDRAMKQAQKDTGIADVNISNLQASGAVQQGLLLSKGVAQLNVLHSHIPSEKLGSSIEEDKGLLEQRLASFEEFRKSYRKHALIEEQKDNLREKIESAQKLGETINACRNAINSSKSAIEQRRIARGVQALAEGGEDNAASALPPDAEEERLKQEIDARKSLYRSSFQSLKELKNEIEHLKGLIDRSRRKLQADFDGWWNTQQKAGTQAEKAAQIKAAREAAANGTGGDGMMSASNTGGNSSARGSPPSSYASSPAPSTPLSPLSSSSRPYVGSAGLGLLRGNLPVQQQPTSGATPPSQTESLRASASAVVAGASTRLPLLSTGNAQADADIAKFYSMRDSLIKQQAAAQQRR